MSLLLSGQTAIVTGAATGIGEAIAIRLANSGARSRSWISIWMAPGEWPLHRSGAFAIRADVAHPAEVKEVVDTCWRAPGASTFW